MRTDKAKLTIISPNFTHNAGIHTPHPHTPAYTRVHPPTPAYTRVHRLSNSTSLETDTDIIRAEAHETAYNGSKLVAVGDYLKWSYVYDIEKVGHAP